MANDRAVAELEQFLAERADRLLRTAVLLTGSREAGQDLLQTAVERLLRHWRTLSGDPEGYLRRTLCNLRPPPARSGAPGGRCACPPGALRPGGGCRAGHARAEARAANGMA
jgi:hypothetical protein